MLHLGIFADPDSRCGKSCLVHTHFDTTNLYLTIVELIEVL
jgi:hypothetical protein